MHACGLDAWSIQQTCAELREGRVAIMPITFAPALLESTFPLAPPSDASAAEHPQGGAIRRAMRALFFPQDEP